ncbi:MAG: hypothetical protein V7739_05375 [Motiliproteus sp.]
MKTILSMVLSLTLILSPGLANSTEDSGSDNSSAQLQGLISELLNNVDLALMLRIQQTVIQNFDLVGPYSEEYFTCLKAEGDFDSSQPLDLNKLLQQVKKSKNSCHVILESLLEQMKFDISQEEFEQGLSPEYRQLLKDSL